ncbi:MAG: hypothetical protein K8S54_06590 [Spirochaetia bacterium]|nr:hypothetical protein [Spirochaetia bacterium]
MASEDLTGEPARAILDAWARTHGAAFAWEPTRKITYTNSSGAFHLSTKLINGRDDWIDVHIDPDGESLELELVADAGHVEVRRVSVGDLARELDGVLAWFQGWADFFSHGPGRGS